jgi:hypothetical protein
MQFQSTVILKQNHMKRILFALFALLIISEGGNCQLLQRKYGVSDYNQLSVEQLNNAFHTTKAKVWGGAIVSYFGTTSLLLAASIKNPGNTTRGPEGEGKAYRDALLVLGLSLDGIGLPILIRNSHRLRAIKRVLGKTKISFEPSTSNPSDIFKHLDNRQIAGVSLKFDF